MCGILVINRGEKELSTPRQFAEHFGFYPVGFSPKSPEELDACLCQCKIEETLKDHNIEFKRDYNGDWYIGDLTNVKGDKI